MISWWLSTKKARKHNLQDPGGAFTQISSAQEDKGMLYLGSLVEDAIGRLPVPGLPRP